MIFPGKETNISNYNETLFAKLAIPSAQAAINTTEDNGEPFAEQRGFLSFKNVDFDHPLFQELFEQPVAGKKTQPAVESPRVYKTIAPQTGPRGHSIIELSDGSVFLMEYTAGSGRALLCSVDASLSWSDFPVKGLFAPLLHRASIYLASRNSATPSFIVGQTIKLSIRTMTLGDGNAFIFKSPSGIEERAVPHPSSISNTATLESSRTQEAGFYELRFIGSAQGSKKSENANLIKTVAVNVDPAESDLRWVSNDELSAFWFSIGVRSTQTMRVPVVEKIETTVLESRFGVELWKYFVGLAVLIALIEMAIARVPKSQELGVELNS
jgi:hypothetical protein